MAIDGVGRPKADIDWNVVNNLLKAGCSGVEIAGRIGILPNTLYDRCEKDNGIVFSSYSQQFYAKGDSIIREKQFEKAEEGDNSMLIWLGKNRLKQRDKPEETEIDMESIKLLAQQLQFLIKQQDPVNKQCGLTHPKI